MVYWFIQVDMKLWDDNPYHIYDSTNVVKYHTNYMMLCEISQTYLIFFFKFSLFYISIPVNVRHARKSANHRFILFEVNLYIGEVTREQARLSSIAHLPDVRPQHNNIHQISKIVCRGHVLGCEKINHWTTMNSL